MISTGTTKAPNLPIAPNEYNRQFFDDLLKILRMYFVELDNPGISAASTNYNQGKILSAMNFSIIDEVGVQQVSLPTEADVALLRVGDLYYDTTADNVIKIKV